MWRVAAWLVLVAFQDTPSMKGWELYLAREKKGPVFGLLVGTNRQKTKDEIRGALNVSGWAALEKKLDALARGDTVLVQGELAPAERKRLGDICKKRGLSLP